MAQCPTCEFSLSEDFGVVTCPQCGTVAVIDMDGQISIDIKSASKEASDEHWTSPSDQATGVAEDVAAESSVESQPWEDPLSEVEFTDPVPITSVPEAPLLEGNFAEALQEFANGHHVAGQEGLLKYHVIVEGIDSFDVRQEIKEALTDNKFIWDIEALLRTIKDGRLEIRDLSAIKASVLVDRIKYLPVKISWEQHAIFDP